MRSRGWLWAASLGTWITAAFMPGALVAAPRPAPKLKTPVAKDLSWPLDIGTEAERRVLHLHAKFPQASEVRTSSAAGQRSIPIHRLADAHRVRVAAKDFKVVLTRDDGSTIETTQDLALGGPGLEERLVRPPDVALRGRQVTTVRETIWRVDELRKLAPTGQLVLRNGRNSTVFPLDSIAELDATHEGAEPAFRVRSHGGGTMHHGSSLTLVDPASGAAPVSLSVNDPRLMRWGTFAEESYLSDRTPAVAQLQFRLRQLLPTADRIVHDSPYIGLIEGSGEATPLALVRSFNRRRGADEWEVWVEGNYWRAQRLIIGDAAGRTVELDANLGAKQGPTTH